MATIGQRELNQLETELAMVEEERKRWLEARQEGDRGSWSRDYEEIDSRLKDYSF